MPNPEYKGPWRQKTKPNPEYKGPWVEPTIPNPDYETDDSLCKFISFYFRTCTGNWNDGVFS